MSRFDRPDFFSKRAKSEGYAARSLYKLEEIDRRHRLIRKGSLVVDLGCAPGSWLQYVAEKVGSKGLVVGVDLSEIRLKLPGTVSLIQADILTLDPARLLEFAPSFDLLLSDAAPKTSGVAVTDHARSVEIARRSLFLTQEVVKPGGSWVCKIFQGEDLPTFRQEAKETFRKLSEFKPKSSRSHSVEIFLVGLGKKE